MRFPPKICKSCTQLRQPSKRRANTSGEGCQKDDWAAHKLECADLVVANAALARFRASPPDATVLDALQRNEAGYFHQGKARAALRLDDEILALASRLHGEQHAAVAGVLGVRAQILIKLGKLDDALAAVSKQRAIFQAARGPDDPLLFSPLTVAASIHASREDWTNALECQREVIRVLGTLADAKPANVAVAHNNLAATYLRLKQYDDAFASHTEALSALKRSEPTSDGGLMASTLLGMGTVQSMQGKLDDAMQSYSAALPLCVARYGETHAETATAMHCVASVLLKQGRAKEAKAMGVRAARSMASSVGAEHPETVRIRKAWM